MAPPTALLRTAVLVCALLIAPAGRIAARPKSSLSDSEFKSAETALALDQALKQIDELKEKLAIADATAVRMTESLAVANGEAEIFRRQAGELKLRLEALGAGAAGGSGNALDQRLIQALSDFRLAENQRRKLAEAVVGLNEAILTFVKTATTADPAARLRLDAQMRIVGEAMGEVPVSAVEAAPALATLTDGQVISIKEELALIVANVGARQGVKVGMPFQVVRDDRVIGSVRIVDVREKVAGAVIQDLSSEKDKVRIGDRLKVAAQQ